jgi:hypothetical protein
MAGVGDRTNLFSQPSKALAMSILPAAPFLCRFRYLCWNFNRSLKGEPLNLIQPFREEIFCQGGLSDERCIK